MIGYGYCVSCSCFLYIETCGIEKVRSPSLFYKGLAVSCGVSYLCENHIDNDPPPQKWPTFKVEYRMYKSFPINLLIEELITT